MKDSRWEEILSGSGQRPTYGELIDEIRHLRAEVAIHEKEAHEFEAKVERLEETGRVTLEIAIPNKNTTWHCFQDDNNNPIMEQLHCDSCNELKAEVERLKGENADLRNHIKGCSRGVADLRKKLAAHEEAMREAMRALAPTTSRYGSEACKLLRARLEEK